VTTPVVRRTVLSSQPAETQLSLGAVWGQGKGPSMMEDSAAHTSSGCEEPSIPVQNNTGDDAHSTINESDNTSEVEANVLIHFREIPTNRLRRDHVISILGPEKAKDGEVVDSRLAEISKWKKDLRAWARQHVKKRVLGNARKLGFTLSGKKPVLVSSFDDLKKWWSTRKRTDSRAAKDLGYVLYGWFDRNYGWDVALERKFMTENKWAYTTESMKAAQENSKRTGLELKGSIALTISYMKVEIVKQMQQAGKAGKHRLVITKSRPSDLVYNDKGKYIKRKKGEYCLMVYDEEETITDLAAAANKGKKVMNVLLSLSGPFYYVLTFALLFVRCDRLTVGQSDGRKKGGSPVVRRKSKLDDESSEESETESIDYGKSDDDETTNESDNDEEATNDSDALNADAVAGNDSDASQNQKPRAKDKADIMEQVK
jgi:hypothetical protein